MLDPEVDRYGFGKDVGPWVGAETVPAPEEGLPPSTVDFIVMELLEGQTVADRLEEGAMSVDDVLRIGVQIADALDKAHKHGLVHRDLKPANIMLLESGTAKLLDFGLARSAAPGDQSPIGVSGDWQWLYLIQMRPNNSDILRVRLDGTGEPEELAATDDDEAEDAYPRTGASSPTRVWKQTTGCEALPAC